MTINEARIALLNSLNTIYDERESLAITDLVFEQLTGLKKIDRILKKKENLSEENAHQLKEFTNQLMAHKPVQYVLSEAWFYGMTFFVNEHVLIPRPETEELVEWALKSLKKESTVLDVGTGSGCISVAIKKEFPSAEVYACDISQDALAVAKKNAGTQGTQINFKQLDFLSPLQRSALPEFDLIISNPPYIRLQEKSAIDKHVVEYEPHIALFVPDSDDLVFYRQLVEFGKSHLHSSGFMFMEIHYAKAEAVKELFRGYGYQCESKKDMHGNDRMIKASKMKA
jgi:release factor glutamine methyltransferase